MPKRRPRPNKPCSAHWPYYSIHVGQPQIGVRRLGAGRETAMVSLPVSNGERLLAQTFERQRKAADRDTLEPKARGDNRHLAVGGLTGVVVYPPLDRLDKCL